MRDSVTGYDRKILIIWKGYLFAAANVIADLLKARDLGDIDSIVFVTEDEITIVADPGRVFCDESERPFVWPLSEC